jgi:thymidylate synthase
MITQPHVIKAPGAVEAWRLAAELLVNEGDRFNLAVHITDTDSLNEADVARYDHRHVDPAIRKSIYDVANTIFPSNSRFHTGNLEQFFTHYQRVYERGQRLHPTAWGVYFLRLIYFGPEGKNQLAGIIHALADWNCRPKAAFVVHLSSAALDTPRPLGAPCWQYGQFVRSENDKLSLIAVYRSQDYFQKALGNFVGLIRLLRFVCQRANMEMGTLTCLSTFATLQNKKVKTRQLIQL